MSKQTTSAITNKSKDTKENLMNNDNNHKGAST